MFGNAVVEELLHLQDAVVEGGRGFITREDISHGVGLLADAKADDGFEEELVLAEVEVFGLLDNPPAKLGLAFDCRWVCSIGSQGYSILGLFGGQRISRSRSRSRMPEQCRVQ